MMTCVELFFFIPYNCVLTIAVDQLERPEKPSLGRTSLRCHPGGNRSSSRRLKNIHQQWYANCYELQQHSPLIVQQGEFYAHDQSTANLELLARFFDKYPNYSHKVFLSVKV